MKYVIYLDESGNTGEPRMKNGKWNWGEQPFFSLGSICLREDKVAEVKKAVLDALHSYNPKLGDEIEWKSTAENKFNNCLMKQIIEIFREYDVKAYIDIANKKFKVVTYFVDYCVYPYYVGYSYTNTRNERIEMANFLYDKLDEQYFQRFDDVCHQDINDDETYKAFLSLLRDLDMWLVSQKRKNLKDVIPLAENYKEYGMKRRNLVPLIDYTNTGKPICFLPNVDAFNNIIATTSVFKLSPSDTLQIVHDEQKQFDNALKQWSEHLKTQNALPIKDVKFIPSNKDILIQLADFLTGRIARVFSCTSNFKPVGRKERDLMKIIKPLVIGNCNIVSVRREQEAFFKEFGLKVTKTPIPFPIT